MSTFWLAPVLGGLILLAPNGADAQVPGPDAMKLRRAQDDFARLSAELDRINAEVAELKRADRSVRTDYRLRERMADAEALAQKVTQAEARLRRQRGAEGALSPGRDPLIAPPQALPQDGSVELEAKADLFADQAKKLVGQADLLTSAAEQLRSRKALHRRAGAWDRDPFAGLESSKRSLAASPSKTVSTGDTRGPSSSGSGSTPTAGPAIVGSSPGTPVAGGTAPPVLAVPAPSDSVTSATAPAPESASSTKSSPTSTSQPAALDRLSVEQRLFLDPATVAELRQSLGSASSTADLDALDRAAGSLRARARALDEMARDLRAKSRAP